MGVCCAQGPRGSNVDKEEKNFRSNSNVLQHATNEHSAKIKAETETGNTDEEEFKRKALEVKSTNESTNVLFSVCFMQWKLNLPNSKLKHATLRTNTEKFRTTV